jgi:uncharacterized membrane protein SpoIIM required for sporulation
MKEVVFINRNSEKWKAFENLLNGPDKDNPDKLAELFVQITDDLAYARTYYPKTDVVKYLNNLAFRSHQLIYVNKKENKNRLRSFWGKEYPMLLHGIRKYIIYSLIILLVSTSVGIISTLNDDTFVRLILGDSYVNMTLSNIDKGDPLAVYKSMNEADMFLGITFNNIKVSIIAFLLGVFLSIGTAFIIFQNGVMLGAFLTFFYQKGLLGSAMSIIWIHGTLEIFAIVVAGAAGLILGNSILFPETYKRSTSFIRGVRKSLKVVLGVAPLFVVAGFLEGFITRYTFMPMVIKLSIIILSLAFIIWYFFIYPVNIFKNIINHTQNEPTTN